MFKVILIECPVIQVQLNKFPVGLVMKIVKYAKLYFFQIVAITKAFLISTNSVRVLSELQTSVGL